MSQLTGPLWAFDLLQLIQFQYNTPNKLSQNLQFVHGAHKERATAQNTHHAFTGWKKRWIIQID